MRRRRFIALAGAAALSACRSPDRQPTAGPLSSATTSGERPSGTSVQPSSTAATTSVVAAPSPSGVAVGDPAFPLGVASGDPDSSSVVLWTRIAPQDPAADVTLAWDVAVDDSFAELAASGIVQAPAADHQTVRVVTGGLDPDRRYWYRFRVGDRVSPVGRTRTMPATGQVPDRMGIAVSSCQARDEPARWDHHRALAADPAVDLVVWLGDFIYDRGAATLDAYRARYAEYRADARLQASSAAHPWVSTWDDHEVTDDYDAGIDPERRLAGYTAWWEHTPTRLPRPTLDGAVVYRSVDIGALARLLVLDCRQYRTPDTILGADQLAWLAGAADHGGRHTVLASPVLVSSIGLGDLLPAYGFEAHPADQQRLIEMLEAAPDPLVVSGDLHLAMQLDLTEGIEEWMAPPLSSGFPFVELVPFLPFGSPNVRSAAAVHGYLHLELTPGTIEPSLRI